MSQSKIASLSPRSTNDLKITFESAGESIAIYVPTEHFSGKSHEEMSLVLASELGCALCCSKKSGYAACVARCLLDGRCCDGGTNNCEDA